MNQLEQHASLFCMLRVFLGMNMHEIKKPSQPTSLILRCVMVIDKEMSTIHDVSCTRENASFRFQFETPSLLLRCNIEMKQYIKKENCFLMHGQTR
jgi:hypothetical protein